MSPKAMRSTPPRMAEELGNERAANVVLLGALSTALDFPADDWEQAIAAVRAEEDHRGQPRGVSPRAAPGSRRRARRSRPARCRRAIARAARAGRRARQVRLEINAAVVQELRHLREALPGALPAAERRAHRRTGRAARNAPAAASANGCARISPSASTWTTRPLKGPPHERRRIA